MTEFTNITELLYGNLDLIEECMQNGIKPIVLVGGASSSGKSYISEQIKDFLEKNNIKSIILSTDNYNKGISENIFDIVNKKYFYNKIKYKPIIVSKIKNIIKDSKFEQKFCDENLAKIKVCCKDIFYGDIDKFLSYAKFEFENINFDQKSIYDLGQMQSDIKKLATNQKLQQVLYSKMISERVDSNSIIDGNQIDAIIIEGIYALDNDLIEGLNHNALIKNFIDCNHKNLFLRRMIRDSQITNCPMSFIIKNYIDFVAPEYINTVLPNKQNADFVLINNMTFEELRKGNLTFQQKYLINKQFLNELLKEYKIIDKINQIDTYFGLSDPNSTLRLREQNSQNGISFDLTYKGMPKFRKDNQIVRVENKLANLSQLKSIFASRRDAINKFESIGLSVDKTIKKQRLILRSKNNQYIKIDIYNDKIYLEFDQLIDKKLIEKINKFESINEFSKEL